MYKIQKLFLMFFMFFFLVCRAEAHFGMVLPSDDIVSGTDKKEITLKVMFLHPFEGSIMTIEKPEAFGVVIGNTKEDLLPHLKKIEGTEIWEISYKIKKPGDHIFYVSPKPYWEPGEETFIIHYTKVIVNAFGLEEGWDKELGLKTEIVPLSRSYGIWTGNVFQGIIKVDGKPAPFSVVEVEYYNNDNKVKAPATPFVTQVIKADQNGVFTYAIPKAGWWGFSSIRTADYKLQHNGNSYPVEIGAVIWIKAVDMK